MMVMIILKTIRLQQAKRESLYVTEQTVVGLSPFIVVTYRRYRSTVALFKCLLYRNSFSRRNIECKNCERHFYGRGCYLAGFRVVKSNKLNSVLTHVCATKKFV